MRALVGGVEERTEDTRPEAYVGFVVVFEFAESFVVEIQSDNRIVGCWYAPSTMKRMKGIETFAVKNSPSNV